MLLLVPSALAAPAVTCDAAAIDVAETCTSGEAVEARVLTEDGEPLPEACEVAWSADAGDFAEASGAVVSWTCPACDDGAASLYVTITDEAGAQDWGFAEVEVACADAEKGASGCASGGAGARGVWVWGLVALAMAWRSGRSRT